MRDHLHPVAREGEESDGRRCREGREGHERREGRLALLALGNGRDDPAYRPSCTD